MGRLLAVLSALLMLGGIATGSVSAQSADFSALARIDPTQSRISAQGNDRARIDLSLSQGVPYRLFTLTNPPRLVMDFQEVDWTGLDPAEMVRTDRILSVQFGTYVPGWSRLVAELAQPMAVTVAAMALDDVTGAARLRVTLAAVSPDDFAATAGAPYDPRWDLPTPADVPRSPLRGPDAPMLVVLDPGHGGIDPGAQQDGHVEKALMLTFARELREVLLRSGGFDVALTRDGDHFVSLERRISVAHQAGADVFISLHADSLAEGLAHGATVHVLSPDASDVASAKLAERHDRGDILSGADLSDTDDAVTGVLLDLARQETQPRTNALAKALVAGMAGQGGPMNRRPMRAAAFSVLKAADIPSVLVEIGFLSSPRDLKNLQDPEWRAKMANGIRDGLVAWRQDDTATRPLVRQ